jgi:hypothetical protein
LSEHKNEDDTGDGLFSGRGPPALMSTKEPALKLLRDLYGETFAITKGSATRVHLFLVKFGLWSLVWTFTPRDLEIESHSLEIDQVLTHVEKSLNGANPVFKVNIDKAVQKSKMRIEMRRKEYGVDAH